jgi:hypothetical protein
MYTLFKGKFISLHFNYPAKQFENHQFKASITYNANNGGNSKNTQHPSAVGLGVPTHGHEVGDVEVRHDEPDE